MKIILDAMGGDNAPEAAVLGAFEAAKTFGLEIILVGRGEAILEVMGRHGTRAAYRHAGGNELPVTQSDSKYRVSVAAPVISEGDLMGSVLFVSERGSTPGTELESKLAQTAACFLGKQMES